MSIFPTTDAAFAAPPASAWYAPAKRRSAGRAWLFSLLMPGTGQLYCGASLRGGNFLTFFIVGVAGTILIPNAYRFVAMRLAWILYAFAGLDAYLTAREVNYGMEAEAEANPRVAAVLNLTTNGFGYVYLGQKLGFLVIIGVLVAGRALGALFPLAAEAFAFVIAVHAYVMATRKREEVYPRAQRPQIDDSRIPAALPIVASALLIAVYYGMATLGQIMLLMGK